MNRINESELYSNEILSGIKTNKIHIVCPARYKNAIGSTLLSVHLNLTVYDIKHFCDSVNTKIEAGCLYPKHSITLVPINETLNVAQCAQDILVANEKYFKTHQIIFAFDRDLVGQMGLIMSSLEKIIDDEKAKGGALILQEIAFISHEEVKQ